MKQIRYWRYAPLAIITLAVLVGGCGHRSSQGSDTGDSSGGASDQSGADRMAAFRAKFPGTAALVSTISGLRQVLKAGQDPMTPNQAGALLALMVPLSSRPSLPQADATALSKNINAELTPQQQNDIGSMREERRNSHRGGGGGGGGQHRNVPSGTPAADQSGEGGGGGAGAGAGRRGGGRGGFSLDQNMAADTNVFAQGRLQEALQDTITMLQAYKAP